MFVFKRWSDIAFTDFEENGGSVLKVVMDWIDPEASDDATNELLLKLKTHIQKKVR